MKKHLDVMEQTQPPPPRTAFSRKQTKLVLFGDDSTENAPVYYDIVGLKTTKTRERKSFLTEEEFSIYLDPKRLKNLESEICKKIDEIRSALPHGILRVIVHHSYDSIEAVLPATRRKRLAIICDIFCIMHNYGDLKSIDFEFIDDDLERFHARRVGPRKNIY